MVKYKSHLAAFDRLFWKLIFIAFSFLNDQILLNPRNLLNSYDLMHLQQMFDPKYFDK